MNDREQREALKRALEGSEPGPPITEDELVAYHRGELSEEEATAFLDRLVSDPEATQALMDLREMDGAHETEAATDETEGAWHEFRDRLTNNRGPVRFRPNQGTNILLAAACLLIVTLAVLWPRDSRGTVMTQRFDLVDQTRGNEALDDSVDHWALDVRISSAHEGMNEYRATVKATDGTLLAEPLVTSRGIQLSFEVASKDLEPGGITMTIEGKRDGTWTLLGKVETEFRRVTR